jgi:hypothetical protein
MNNTARHDIAASAIRRKTHRISNTFHDIAVSDFIGENGNRTTLFGLICPFPFAQNEMTRLS